MNVFPNKWMILPLMMALFLLSGCGDEEESTLPAEEGVYGSAEEEQVEVPRTELTAQAVSDTYQEALSTLDLSQCEEIEDVVIQESCIVNIAFAQAKETQDPASCDPIESESTKESCLKMIEAMQKEDEYNPFIESESMSTTPTTAQE
ncbi:MAG: hypothetical protein ACD_28C00197G0002 [uncultured bacterium]|nr:MAG: hypothetical protein ACD_28C00197G0002 [uncultured bacterium]